MRLNHPKSALMDAYTPGRRVVGFRVPVCYLFFIDSRQAVRVIVVLVCVELAKKGRYVVVEFLVPGFPPERHNYMLIHKRGVCNHPGFLVLPLIERDRQSPDFLLDRLFKLGPAVV